MIKVALGFIMGIFVSMLITGCTFSLDGLKATDGDKSLNLDHVESTE